MQQIEKLDHGETSILGMEGDWVKLGEKRTMSRGRYRWFGVGPGSSCFEEMAG
ncbi:MAG: hypothetical protein WBQ89_22935 [Candidatus Acidiferrum sp.]